MSRRQHDIERLLKLVNYRWTLPVVAELSASGGGKFVTLSRRLGVGRESLRRSLSTLIDCGLVERNPGHGHPMRPEYILTAAGRRIGPASERLVLGARSLDIEALAFQKWSLPVVHSVGVGATRFRGIQTRLPSLTSRALSLTLKGLARAGVVDRAIEEAYPPISTYELTGRGARLASLVTQLNARL